MFNKYISILLLIVFATISTKGQEANKIKGIITEKGSETPVVGALIILKDTNQNTTTDSKGNFYLDVSTTKDIMIAISHLSFKTFEAVVEPNTLNKLQMEWKSFSIEDILVKDNPLQEVAHSEIIHDNIKSMGRQKNVADVFQDVNGFGIIKRGAYAMDPSFRAFKYEQLNIQCDGGTKVMNACPNRMDPITTHIISEEIQKVELIKGPFSMRFGPNFGGVVNLVTQQRPSTDDYGFHGSVQNGYEFNGDSKILGVSVSNASSKYDLILNGEYHDFGNYKDGNDVTTASSFSSLDYSVKTGWNPDRDQRLQLAWRQSYGKDVLHAGLPMDTKHDNSSILSLDYKKQHISNKLYSFSAKGFYSYVDHLMTNDYRPNFTVVEASSSVYATTYGGKIEMIFTPNNQSIVYAGADMNNISRTGNRIRLIKRNPADPEIIFDPPKIKTDSIWQDSKINNYGVFGESKFTLNSKTNLSAALRIDFVMAKIESPAQDFSALYSDLGDKTDINISGSLTLGHQLNDEIVLQLALGRGVRSASMVERYINHFGVGSDPYEYVGNPNLKAEANHQLEFSFKSDNGKIQYGASTFYSLITNYITASIDTTLSRKFLPWLEPIFAKRFVNANLGTQLGFEAYVSVPLYKDLRLKVDAAYIKARNEDLNESMPLISPLTTLVSLNYNKENYWVDLRARFSAKQSDIAESFGEKVTPAYQTIDLRVGFKPIKSLSVGMAVINLLDESYYDHLNFSFTNSNTNSGRIYETGRNLTAFLKYSF